MVTFIFFRSSLTVPPPSHQKSAVVLFMSTTVKFIYIFSTFLTVFHPLPFFFRLFIHLLFFFEQFRVEVPWFQEWSAVFIEQGSYVGGYCFCQCAVILYSLFSSFQLYTVCTFYRSMISASEEFQNVSMEIPRSSASVYSSLTKSVRRSASLPPEHPPAPA